MALHQLGDRRLVHGGVLADGRVRAAPGLQPDDAVHRQNSLSGEDLGVLDRVDVVGDGGHGDLLAHGSGDALDELGLARPHWATHSDTDRSVVLGTGLRLPGRVRVLLAGCC